MMEVIKIEDWNEIPKDYTGIAKYADGSKQWFLNGKSHREDGPAIEWVDGSKYWNLNGELHREDGPAVEWADGSKGWWLNGKQHREDGPACEWADGEKAWYLNDNFLFRLLPKSQPFVFLEEFLDAEGKEQLRVLNQKGIEIWPCVPGLKELAENWEKKQ